MPANQEGESELEEVERELGSKQAKVSGKGGLNGDTGKKPGVLGRLKKLLPPIFLEAFVLTFLAEWGDRSQVLPMPQFRPVNEAPGGLRFAHHARSLQYLLNKVEKDDILVEELFCSFTQY